MINAVTGVQAIIINSTDSIKTEVNNNFKEKKLDVEKDAFAKAIEATKVEEPKKSEEKQVDFSEFASNVQKMLGADSVALEFSIDKDTKKMVLKIIDKETKEVIQQVPQELALKVAKFVADQLGHGQVADAQV
jgi:flagellar protein FlaG